MKNTSWRGKATKTRSFEKIREIHLQTLFLILKSKNLQIGVKIQVFLSPFIFTCDIYYEIITLFFFLSFPSLTLKLALIMASYVYVLIFISFMKLSFVMWFRYVKRNGWLCNIRNLGWVLLPLILD